ncbi:MAG TPA: hypothetical protein VIM30_15660 [Candidatus Limnocylindrales bacterium]|jgi:hypothetical protein
MEASVPKLHAFVASRPALAVALWVVLAVLLAACQPGGSGGTGY